MENMPNDIVENDGKERADQESIGKENTGKESIGKENTGKENTGKENTGKENTGKENTGKESAGKGIGLPLLALGLVLFPFVLVYVSIILENTILLLLCLFSPIAGLITGIAALRRGKRKTGIIGKFIAICAVVLPTGFVVFIISFIIGVSTGVISLM